AEDSGVPRRAAEDGVRQDQPPAGWRRYFGARRMSDVMERPKLAFSADALHLGAAAEIDRIAASLREQVLRRLRKRGVVLGLSGGIDSSLTAVLCARALGPDRVFAVLMPEKDSDPESLRLGRLMVETLGIASAVEDIAPILAAAGC